nr:non-ribosomal peptide synthetase [Nocardia cerradoensis]
MGRIDFQVKFRGQRIELGEIEAALLAAPGVSQAVALVVAGPTGEQLVGYAVPAPGHHLDATALRAGLASALPSYMVPAVVTVLDALPLNTSGKLDRKALPAPVFEAQVFAAPVTVVEELVANVFAEVLGIERVGRDDDFFALGGNSLSATRVAARLGAALDTRVPVRLVFEAGSVAALASRVETSRSDADRPALTARPRPDRIPLSLAQQRMWFLNQFDTTSPANNIPFAVRLTGALDITALRAAIGDLVARHEVLRTVYPAVDGVGYQSVLPPSAVPDVPVIPIAESEIEGWVTEFALRGFDVAAEVPLRIAVLEPETDVHVVVMVTHHIAADGASVAPLVRDLMTAYLAQEAGSAPTWTPLPVQYADYTLWQRDLLGDEEDPQSAAAGQIAFWREALAGLPERLDLPADRPRPYTASGVGRTLAFEIPASTRAAAIRLARAQNSSEFMVVHAAFAALLARLSGTSDIAIGTPVAGRGERELDDLIGMFVNTLVLRTEVDPGESFTDLLARVKRTDLAAFSHAELPFERLVEVMDPVRAPSQHPLFQVALFFQNLEKAGLELPGIRVDELGIDGAIAKFDLQLTISPPEDESAPAAALFAYATDLFDESTVDAFATRFVRLLDALLTDPERSVGDVDVLSVGELAGVVRGRNETAYPVSAGLLLDGFRRAVVGSPGAVAVVGPGGESLTYAELDARVNGLARVLVGRGVGPESLVGLAVRRSVDLVVGMYAVLTAGGAYVPLDPDHPVERVGYVLDVARPVCVLTVSRDGFVVPGDVPVVEIDTVDLSSVAVDALAESELRAPVRPSDTAYVIFTSGSTGRPKGVAVSHGAIHNQIEWMLSQYPLAAGDVYLQKTATTFDVSLWGFFMPLRAGATLVVATPDGHRDPLYVAETIAAQRVTVTDFVPSMLSVFAAHADRAQLASLRHVFVIGEALPPETVSAFAAVSDAELHNLYGPTEAAVSITYWPAVPGAGVSVPIGVPQWNSQVYVLDSRLRPVPDGVVGELYLAGDQLARGYLGRPDLTSDRFVANPFGVAGARMYRTGDLVRWTRTASGDPVLDYLGRIDFQVKFRGQRIELGEIEAALLAAPGVSQAVAVVAPGPAGEQLVGYAVAAPNATLDSAALRDAVADRLPSYMVPSAVLVLDALPLNTSGKLDRKALPAPVFETHEYTAPATPIEETVAAVFAEVLGIERVGRDDDFFALGGNSLSATRVAARLGAALDTQVPVRLVFETGTVAGLAARVEAQAPAAGRPALVAGPRPARIPLSPAQQRMWFLNQFDTASPAYNITAAVRLTGALDIDALNAAVADLVARHEILRTWYPQDAEGPVQRIRSAAEATPELRAVAVDATELADSIGAVVARGFDVAAEVPVRVALFALGADEYALVLVVHHIAGDGWSMGPLTRDLMAAYAARSNGDEPGWAPLPLQYADYALWQRELLGDETDDDSLAAEQIAFWKSALAGLPEESTLPADRPRPATQSFRAGTVDAVVDADVHAGLKALARNGNASVFVVVHTALAVLLSRLSGNSDVAIGTPVAGRGAAELDDVVGMFVNTVVLRTTTAATEPFTALLARQRDTDLAAFAHADLPFERLVEALDPVRSTGRSPLFQVALSFENLPSGSFELPGLRATALESDTGVERFDVTVTVTETDSGLAVRFTYARDLFDEATIRAFAERFGRVLSAVAADPAIDVADLPLLSAAETERLTRVAGPAVTTSGTLPDLMAAAAAAAPEAIALRGGGRSMTYAELDARSSRLARELIGRGIGPGDRVALGIPRSIESVLAVWAVAKAGAAFVPIDPNYPAERIERMVTDSEVRLGLVVGAVRDRFPATVEWLLLDHPAFGLELERRSGAPVSDAERIHPLRPADVAYMIYTSGSSGLPKGVLITHAGIAGYLAEQRDRFGVTPQSRTLHFASPSFDAAMLELLLALAGPATMVIAPTTVYGGAELAEFLRAERVTHAFVTAAAMASVDPTGLDELEVVVTGGESWAPELVRRWAVPVASGTRRFYNAYGPTEATIATNISDALRPGEPVTLGGPIRGITAWVLDERLRPVPAGVAGELYVAGAQLARGYHRRPGLTAERFVACPWLPGVRMYRTGDVVRWLSAPQDGGQAQYRVEYLGRNDFQVKVRGFRIELGEIDAVLTAHESVDFAVTVGRTAPSGATALVSYVLPAATGATAAFDRQVLDAHAREQLPAHMVPAMIIVLDRIPLTPVGKLDRAALPEPVFEATAFRAPVTATEQAVAAVYAEVLGVERVGLDDDFFALGGNSLSATRVVARLGAALDAEVPVRLVFEAATVERLAAQVETSAAAARPALTARSTAPAATGSQEPERIPLSPAQQRMWFLNQFDTESAAYNIPIAVRLIGRLDVPALRRAVGDVVARHEILRTYYPQTQDGPVQVVEPASQAAPQILPMRVAERDLAERIIDVIAVGFDVSAEVPLRVALFRLTDRTDEHVIVFVVHHIAGDGWSMGPLTRDVMAAYAARAQQLEPEWAPLPVQYADYSVWQRELLGAEDDPQSLAARQIDYWRNALADLPEESTLPADRPRPNAPSYLGAGIDFTVDADVRQGLVELARRANTTMFMVVHAALAVLLGRMSGSSDVAIGTPVAGRGQAALDDLIGMFVNTLVLRSELRPGESFLDLLARQRETDLAAFANADIPFERLVDALAPERSTVRSPLFQVSLAFQNLPSGSFELPGLRVEAVDFDVAIEKFDLSVTLFEAGDAAGDATLAGRITYARDLFDESTIREFAQRYHRVLREIAAAPDTAVADIELLTDAERDRVLGQWVSAGTDSGPETTLVEVFDAAAAAHADRTALIFGDERIGYAELSQRVNRLARTLIEAGAGPETLVAVALPRSADLVVALLAAIRAGAGYLPVDPTYPADRIAYMLDDARPICAVTTSDREIELRGVPTVVELDRLDLSAVSADPITPAERRGTPTPDSIAYVIYTSGSTGRPKGVQVPHRTVAKLFANTRDWFAFDETDVWTMFHSYAFDFSVWELWGPLLHGGALVVVDYHTSRSPEQFLELLRRERVTVLNQTPSAFYQLDAADQAAADSAAPLALRYVVYGGEALELRRLNGWYDRHGDAAPRLINMYGITETTVHVTYRALDAAAVAEADGSVIGRAIPGLRTYLLDNRLRPVPVGVPGEIYVAGTQLARGYLGQPALTAGRFVADPFGAPGTRLYRSGDLARWNADGDLEYLGRADDQVKVRGFRIELGEIEAAVLSRPGIAQAAVLVREDRPGDPRIVAYVVPEDPADRPSAGNVDDRWRAGVAESLPEYMVPSAFVVLDAIPLTANGKLDRRALPAPAFAVTASRTSLTALETRLAELFAQVLGVPEVGVDDSFFAVGGDSIMSIQLVSRAKAAGIVFTPRDVFEHRTVAGLARVAVADGLAEPEVLAELPGGGVGEIPLTPVLAAYLDSGVHNRFAQTMVLGLPEHIDESGLIATIAAVLDHHDVLRSRVRRTGEGWTFEALPTGSVDVRDLVTTVDVPAGVDAAELNRIASAAMDSALAALDPQAGRMLTFTWLRRPDGRDAVTVAAHHYVIDGVSWRILIPDLAVAWAQRSAGAPIELPPVGTSFRRWAHGLVTAAESDERVAETDYWRSVLATPDPLLGARALDPAVDTHRTVRRFETRVPVEVADAVLTRLPALYRGGVNDGLLAALALAVRTWRGRRGIDAPVTRVKLEGHGREETTVPGADLTRTIGWFTSIYPVSLDLTGIDVGAAFAGAAVTADLVKSVKEQLLAVPDRGIGYGLLRYLNPESAPAVAGELGQISFNYLGRVSAGGVPEGLPDLGWLPTAELGSVVADQDPDMPAAAVIDVNAIVNDGPDGPLMDVTFLYAADIVGEDAVRELAQDWVSALTALARHAQDPAAGGLTPSDVPLVRVGQAELDAWREARPGLSDVLPLSPLQEGLLFLTELQAADGVDDYVMQFALELSGDIDLDRLHRSAQAVLDRHANLRTAFVTTATGVPVQLVVDDVEVPWKVVTGVADDELTQVLAADRYRFDPAVAPLVRFTVYRTDSGATHLALTTHHILLDGWSMPLLMKDLLILYAVRGDSSMLPRVRPYRDYLAWLSRQDHDRALSEWAGALAGLEPSHLAPALAAPATPGDGIGTLTFDLSPEQTRALTTFAAKAGVTVNTVVQAAWGAVIAAHTDRDDVVFGAAVSGRPPQLDGIDDMIGLFVNTIPVRVRFDPRWSVRDALQRLQSEQAARLDQHHIGLAEIQGALGVEGLFDTMIAFESYPIDTEGLQEASTIDGMAVTGLQAVNFTHYPLTVLVNLDSQLRVKMLYRHDTVDAAAAAAVTDRLRMLIGEFVAAPRRGLPGIGLLLDAERTSLAARNDTAAPELLDDATLVSLFHAQCDRTPDAPAVTFGDRTLTYAELRSAATGLAGALVEAGAGPETRVAVAMRRSAALVVALYAVLESGAAYVPVDPDHPAERNDHVLRGSSPLCVLTTAADGFTTATGIPVVDVASLTAHAAQPLPRPRPDNAAYVIYTSGSTGRPKGVVITHRQVANQFRWAQARYPHGVGDTVLHKTPITFDISTWELFWPLQTGARIVVAEPDGHRDPQYLAEVIARESIGTVHFVPAMLDAFLELGRQPNSPLRLVFAAGEALTTGTAAAFHDALPAQLHNWYGPAEATVVTAARAGRTAVPIGDPVANTRVYVLDRQLRQVPAGAAGELYVAGVQLARGYHGAAALTAERFVADPFEPGGRLYRTGDIVRFGEAGLEYLGRADFQVKLRGQRIELGEIEAVLLDHDSVAHAAAAVVPDPDRLVAYVVPAAGRAVDPDELTAYARRRLPAYMVPAVLMPLAELPLNASGKLDRRALPIPALAARPYREPVTGLQQSVAAAFADVLDTDRVGLDDDFFALGGTSLNAGRVVHQLRRVTGAEIRVQWFFLDPTVAGISARIAESLEAGLEYDEQSDAALGLILPIRAAGDRRPLFCIHPMYGLSWCYAGLARYTDPEQPIFGVQAAALSEDSEPPRSLAEMADRYVREIVARQPEGPYRLLGWSLGGLLAHEVAVRLRAAGHEVDLLAMLDSDHGFDLGTFREAMQETLAELGIRDVDPERLDQLTEEDFVRLHDAIPADLVVLTQDRLRRIYTSAMRSVQLTRGFVPQVFDGTVHYFRAAADERRTHDVIAGWRPYAGDVVDHPVPTRHELMTQPEALAVIGPVLQELLRDRDRAE